MEAILHFKIIWKVKQYLLRHSLKDQTTKMSKMYYEHVGGDVDWLKDENYRSYTFKCVRRKSRFYRRILDVGCGDGRALAALNVLNKVGLDFSKNLLKMAVNRDPPIQAVMADARYLPFSDDAFCCVMLFEVVEHVSSPDLVFEEAKRVARGDVFVTTDYEGLFIATPRVQFVDNTPKLRAIRKWSRYLTFFKEGKPTAIWKGLLFGTGLMIHIKREPRT